MRRWVWWDMGWDLLNWECNLASFLLEFSGNWVVCVCWLGWGVSVIVCMGSGCMGWAGLMWRLSQ